ncbi:MAG: hypothetical protein WC855_12360 [Thermodesulfovibrionales bacterium]
MLDNKWKHGKAHFELPQLPPVMVASPGIKPISAVLDNKVGEEIVLLITEPQDKVREFEGRNITRFMLKAGLVNTAFGPVCWLLFYFPDPLSGGQVTYENTINPKAHDQLSIYEKLSNQKYWHVVIANDAGEVVNFFEFPNEYGLSDTLHQVKSVCSNMQVTDFIAAKAEYESKYSIDQLLAM